MRNVKATNGSVRRHLLFLSIFFLAFGAGITAVSVAAVLFPGELGLSKCPDPMIKLKRFGRYRGEEGPLVAEYEFTEESRGVTYARFRLSNPSAETIRWPSEGARGDLEIWMKEFDGNSIRLTSAAVPVSKSELQPHDHAEFRVRVEPARYPLKLNFQYFVGENSERREILLFVPEHRDTVDQKTYHAVSP